MSKTIWKYTLTPNCIHPVPRGAKALCVQMQNEKPQLWMLVDPDEPLKNRRFVVHGTGHELPDDICRVYIGTFQMNQGDLVLHVFEEDL